VLVVGREQPRRDERAEVGLPAGLDGTGRQDAGELDLELDRAVEVEVPVEAVLVVADRGMNDSTRRRLRRTSARSVRKSVCFQPIEASSSCMQMALPIRTGWPSWSLTWASK